MAVYHRIVLVLFIIFQFRIGQITAAS